MSTWSDLTWAVANREVRHFEYPAVRIGTDIPGHTAPAPEDEDTQYRGQLELQVLRAREEGVREGEKRARAVFDEGLQQHRQQISIAVASFADERDGYFRRVESEVVQLALAIARKVLHREAQVDKQLLAHMVRAALDELADGTEVVLRVSPSQEAEWTHWFSDSSRTQVVRVVADSSLTSDRCVISTNLGTTDIGIEDQLKEIEQGLFDLIAQRPEPPLRVQ